jgi:hypothetical protein
MDKPPDANYQIKKRKGGFHTQRTTLPMRECIEEPQSVLGFPKYRCHPYAIFAVNIRQFASGDKLRIPTSFAGATNVALYIIPT